MDRVKSTFGMEDEEKGLLDQADDYLPSLTWEQRFWGFGICAGVATFLGILSVIFLFLNELTSFAIFYTFANVGYLSSTFFLVGPVTQVKKMGEEHRLAATVIFVISMILTLVVAIALKSGVLALLFVIIQSAALFWYTLTYIPGARTVLQSCCSVLLG